MRFIQFIFLILISWGLLACTSNKASQKALSEKEILEIWNHSTSITSLDDYFALRNNLIDAYHFSNQVKWILNTEGYDVGRGEEWFENKKDGKVWRLIPPAKNQGVWEPVQKEFLSKSCPVKLIDSSEKTQNQWDEFKRLQQNLPFEVAVFMERAKNCYHFRGEEKYSEERKREIAIQEEILKCSLLEQDREKLKMQYSKDREALLGLELVNEKSWEY